MSPARDRVVVFLDYQNAYMGAREAFFMGSGHHTRGQFDPWRLGELLAARGLNDRALAQVRVYRGLPDVHRDQRGHSAARRQCASWESHPGTEVYTRTLSYPASWPQEKAREKGVDVALAVDFVVMAERGEYDVGILMSCDTDLRPALEVVSDRPSPRPRCEVAAWSARVGHSRRLSVPGRKVWCHWLDEADHASVADRTDYGTTAG